MQLILYVYNNPNLKLNLALKKWLYNAQLIKYDINKIRIGFFCKKILYKLNEKKIESKAQNNWKNLTSIFCSLFTCFFHKSK